MRNPRLTGEELRIAAADLNLQGLIGYCIALSSEFQARRDRVRNYVRHNLTSGNANEAVLRAFLSSIAPGVCGVDTGFLCNPLRGEPSRQCDIIVHDRRFPLVLSESGVTVVWPEAARMTIEVKTGLKRKDLNDAIRNVDSVKRIFDATHTLSLIFAFDSIRPDAVLRRLSELPDGEAATRPMAVLLLERGVIIHQPNVASAIRFGVTSDDYEVRVCNNDNRQALVVAYLVLLFLQQQAHYAPTVVTAQNLWVATDYFLETYTAPWRGG